MGAFDHEIRALRRIRGGAPEKRVLKKVHNVVKKRIFVEGKDSSGNDLGEYSLGYQRERARKGIQPIRKIVLVNTGQMRDNFILIETAQGFESSFRDFLAAAKSGWVTSTYDKQIFALTTSEEQLLDDLIEAEINHAFRNAS